MNKCAVDGCEKLGRAAGMCHGHYKRLRTFGTTAVKPGSKAPIADRFQLYVDKQGADECWPWKASVRGAGYGRIKSNGITFLAHRVSYEIHIGPIPDGMLVCHHCDNPRCVNPKHLFIGTQKDNLADRGAKGRFHPVNGESNGMSKLTEHQVLAILKDGRPQKTIAAEHGITRPMVSQIKRGHSWKHLKR